MLSLSWAASLFQLPTWMRARPPETSSVEVLTLAENLGGNLRELFI
jgi:hypothetical protein